MEKVRVGASQKEERSRSVKDDRMRLLEKWEEGGPWAWFTGIDTTEKDKDFPKGRPIMWTKDEGKKQKAIAPWPDERKYPLLRNLVEDVWTADQIPNFSGLILIDKVRQVMATWAITLLADYDCRFHEVRNWFLSKTKENEAIKILDDKPRFVLRRMPEWLRAAQPVKTRPTVQNEYLATESYFRAVTENIADSEARGSTTSGIIVDEAAFQRKFPNIVAAAQPMATLIIAITTANIGNPGARYFYDMTIEGRQEGAM